MACPAVHYYYSSPRYRMLPSYRQASNDGNSKDPSPILLMTGLQTVDPILVVSNTGCPSIRTYLMRKKVRLLTFTTYLRPTRPNPAVVGRNIIPLGFATRTGPRLARCRAAHCETASPSECLLSLSTVRGGVASLGWQCFRMQPAAVVAGKEDRVVGFVNWSRRDWSCEGCNWREEQDS